MSRYPWLRREIAQWHVEGLITAEQKERLLARYTPSEWRSSQIILWLAGLLVGLGIILLVAHNWDDIPRLVRLGLICGVITVTYSAGYLLAYGSAPASRAGNYPRIGSALLLLGLLSYGAGIWLVGQMYHIPSYDATGLGLWFLGAIAVAYLTGHPLFFLSALALLTAANISDATDYAVSLVTGPWFFAAFAFLVLPFLWRRNQPLHRYGATIAFFVSTLVQLLTAEQSLIWLSLFPLFNRLYEQVREHRHVRFPSLLSTPLLLWGAFLAEMAALSNHPPIAPYSLWLVTLWLILACFVLWIGFRGKRLVEGLALFALSSPLPFASRFLEAKTQLTYFGHSIASLSAYGEATTLIILFIGAILLIQSGSRLKEEWQINSGTLFFLFCVLYAYGRYAWGLLDKSLFFIGGGLILFALGYMLERNRRQLLHTAGKEG
ncbi:DUF2157 domain-containing protein [Heliobacterium gestii]|uniref:DUF2157 domain-containing protein n=1 Tax=Heliomicrobium gestii TaxID=2699 RepID=A0A845LB65_HELGE|nr:DUF2157 domain-containing protein [Heliomicrobium gestii]MBM7865930.1 putative membrane protein [Heliomicrobium gestii]MZP42170.1 DUF2157 domain-containing protein [Heliomicrobium gestii]